MLEQNWADTNWIWLSQSDVATAYVQGQEEGRDLTSLAKEYEAVGRLDLSKADNQRRANKLLDGMMHAPFRPDYPYREPDDLERIRKECPEGVSLPRLVIESDAILDKVYGGWLGRTCGCMLGVPVEGRRRHEIETYLKAQNRWPLAAYFSRDVSDDVARETNFNVTRPGVFAETITHAVEDDDMNYTTLALHIVEEYGTAFTTEHVAQAWLRNLPVFRTFTAERVAYRNLLNCVPPPASARLRNPYREWIGAQIRADLYGYVQAGNPQRAAALAWNDAVVSHVKNGVYGAMWVAAMNAAAFVVDDVELVLRAGLAEVPRKSRLAEAVARVLSLYTQGFTYEEAINDVHERWDEGDPHHWCHVIPNAEIVTVALLWGGLNYSKTIAYGVMAGFDTDCNAATAGSIVGVIVGASQLPERWTAPLNDTLHTGIAGMNVVSLSDMARRTAAFIGS